MNELKRKPSEIIALYTLESKISDLYVEGNMDKAVINSFLKNKKINKKVYPIDVIDFTELHDRFFCGLDKTSNKSKVIALSNLFNEDLPKSMVYCIVDKDFDDYIPCPKNGKLLRTDFSCLEAYLFNEILIDKFLTVGIGNFPFSSKFILTQLSNVLKSFFCIRLIRELHYRYTQLVAFSGNLKINKQTGVIEFSEDEYLQKFLLKNSLVNEREKILTLKVELEQNLSTDVRNSMNGHDFIEILFLYINKVKNTPKFKEENFGKSLFLTLESSMIENYPLFNTVMS